MYPVWISRYVTSSGHISLGQKNVFGNVLSAFRKRSERSCEIAQYKWARENKRSVGLSSQRFFYFAMSYKVIWSVPARTVPLSKGCLHYDIRVAPRSQVNLRPSVLSYSPIWRTSMHRPVSYTHLTLPTSDLV